MLRDRGVSKPLLNGALMGRGASGRQWVVRFGTAVLGVLVLIWAARLSAQERLLAPTSEVASTKPLPLPETPESTRGEWSPTLLGTIVDPSGAVIPDAKIVATLDGSSIAVQVLSKDDGTFAFEHLAPGQYRITVQRESFHAWSGTASVSSGQQVSLGEVALQIAGEQVVEVGASNREIAAAQLQLAERQRVLGIFPNFYASYVSGAEPLSARQKFQLAARFAGDPVAFAMAGVVASSEQRADAFHGYGRGIVGYSKRYGAAYTDGVASTFIGQALLPVVFHQDPRYFVKGTGSMASRVMYAMASMVICKGDNGRWQPNYSNVLGNFASASLSNAYYPSTNRGGGLVVQTALTATAMGAVGGLFQEFLLHRMTPNVPDYAEVR